MSPGLSGIVSGCHIQAGVTVSITLSSFLRLSLQPQGLETGCETVLGLWDLLAAQNSQLWGTDGKGHLTPLLHPWNSRPLWGRRVAEHPPV